MAEDDDISESGNELGTTETEWLVSFTEGIEIEAAFTIKNFNTKACLQTVYGICTICGTEKHSLEVNCKISTCFSYAWPSSLLNFDVLGYWSGCHQQGTFWT